MPTDVAAVYARKRMAKAQTQANVKVVVLFVLIGLLSTLVRLMALY